MNNNVIERNVKLSEREVALIANLISKFVNENLDNDAQMLNLITVAHLRRKLDDTAKSMLKEIRQLAKIQRSRGNP